MDPRVPPEPPAVRPPGATDKAMYWVGWIARCMVAAGAIELIARHLASAAHWPDGVTHLIGLIAVILFVVAARRAGRRLRQVPAVRAAVAWLVTEPDAKSEEEP